VDTTLRVTVGFTQTRIRFYTDERLFELATSPKLNDETLKWERIIGPRISQVVSVDPVALELQ
jgi:hypothetical protein